MPNLLVISALLYSTLSLAYADEVDLGNKLKLLQYPRISFRFDPVLSPFLVVSARINGSKYLDFMLDTGLNAPLILHKNAMEAAHISLTSRDEVKAIVKGVFEGPSVRLDLLASNQPSISFEDVESLITENQVVQNATGNTQIAGVIGLPLLRSFPLSFDFVSKHITVLPAASKLKMDERFDTIPIIEKNGLVYVEAKCGRAKCFLMVDTGSDHTNFELNAVASVPHVGNRITATFTTAAEYLISDAVHIPEMRLGNVLVGEVDTVLLPDNADLVLGNDSLARLGFTLDLQNHRMIVRRTQSDQQYVQPGYMGIDVQADAEGCLVIAVKQGTPAAATGLKAGDRLTQVDGQALIGLTTYQILRLLNGRAVSIARITTKRRDGAVIVMNVKREPRPQQGKLIEGAVFRLASPPDLTIATITSNSIWDHEKLKAGDAILSVNSKPVSSLSVREIVEAFEARPLVLVVKQANQMATVTLH